MNFGLSEDQVLFKSTVKRFLEEQCPTTRVRAIMESDSGHDAGLWQGLVDLGIAGQEAYPFVELHLLSGNHGGEHQEDGEFRAYRWYRL